MTNAKIVITDCNHADIDEEKAVFEAAGIPYRLCQSKTEDDVIANCRGAVAVCNQRAPFTEKVFAALPELKMVVRYGDGGSDPPRRAGVQRTGLRYFRSGQSCIGPDADFDSEDLPG